MQKVFSIFAQNLAYYNEGSIEGGWLDLPQSPEVIDNFFDSQGILVVTGNNTDEPLNLEEKLNLPVTAADTELAFASMDETMAKEKALRDHLIERLEKEIPYSRLNGDRVKRLPNNVNFCFRFIEGESLLILLDQNGICASSGSACTSGSLDPSHVLLAIGLPHEIAHGSLRLTLSEDNTMEEMDFVADQAKKIVERLRSMSPLYDDFVKKQNQ